MAKLKNVIIGFAGKPQVGKDTALNYIVEKYGGARVSTGDVIKIEFNKMLEAVGLSYDEARKNEFRSGLDWLAVYRRNEDPDYWVKKSLESIPLPALVPDVRYPNEVRIIEGRGGRIFKIVRTVGRDTSQDNFEAQMALEDHKFIEDIENNGSFEDLYKKLDQLLIKYDLIEE